jgi:CheY-like chemotaxis protein
MKILIAEDDLVTRRLLEVMLTSWGFEVVSTADGSSAWELIQADDSPRLLIFDWMMPGMEGPELCQRLRSTFPDRPTYVMLLTTKDSKDDIISGLHAGADDYVTKPFDSGELRARINVGARVIGLQSELADRVRSLEAAMTRIRQLEGILPICAYCKKIRSDQNYWFEVERYLTDHSDVRFSHSICPSCYDEHFANELEGPSFDSEPPTRPFRR